MTLLESGQSLIAIGQKGNDLFVFLLDRDEIELCDRDRILCFENACKSNLSVRKLDGDTAQSVWA